MNQEQAGLHPHEMNGDDPAWSFELGELTDDTTKKLLESIDSLPDSPDEASGD